MLEWLLIRRRGIERPYCQSANFFSFDQIEANAPGTAKSPDGSGS